MHTVLVRHGYHARTKRYESKIEKVPRGIRGEKSSKDMASSRNLVSTIGALASPKMEEKNPEHKTRSESRYIDENKIVKKNFNDSAKSLSLSAG